MKAFVTSIGEVTTDLCIWSLERQGLEVELVKGQDSLASKLEYIFATATDNFVRVDADVIVNRNIKELIKQDQAWWYQARCFGWYSQDVIHGGIQFVRKQAIPIVQKHIQEAFNKERPESYLYRLPEFHNPRRCLTFDKVCGLHGYAQNDYKRVIGVKTRRGQLDNYDFELAERLDLL